MDAVNKEKALDFARKAAEQGHAWAQWAFGRMCANGEGVAKDQAEAVRWYRKAAEQGLAVAQNNLGWMYAGGRGVAKDLAEAVKWYRKAAEQGDVTAQRRLGKVYADGRGVAKDMAEAVKWYRMAADHGNAAARQKLKRMVPMSDAPAPGLNGCSTGPCPASMLREHLIRLIREDRTLARDARRLRALLSDHCPSSGARLRALLQAQAHGVVGELETADATTHRNILFARMAKHLFEEAGLRQDLCEWAVETWHLALTTTPANVTCITTRRPGDLFTVDLGQNVTMEMVWIPPGEFVMGSPKNEGGRYVDETQHLVKLAKGFWMGKYEVTQDQWQQVMGNNPSRFKEPRNPVETVSWNDCQPFLKKLNSETTSDGQIIKQFRLPTEAEWEYACRAGTTTRFHNGDSDSELGNVAWYRDNSGHTTHPVGQKAPNAWGLYDMHGNVYECCLDWVQGHEWPYRVFRGGCGGHSAGYCRSARRGGNDPSFRNYYGGFRLSSTLP